MDLPLTLHYIRHQITHEYVRKLPLNIKSNLESGMNRPALRLAQAKTRTAVARKALTSNGFTMIELVVVLAVGMVLTAMAVPVVQSTLLNLRLQSAAGSVSSAIQTTRYQSIQQGYQYKLTLTKSTATYQLASKPGAASSFSDIGSAIPFAKTDVVLNADTVLYFSPRGVIGTSAGSSTCPTAATLTLTQSGQTKTITVSCYGQINIT